ncbi:MAG: hypothetical protein JWN14_5175 [Chthonomonadales bacterium]|nr:hypothetical protein [Chthonomonadales bacterium]
MIKVETVLSGIARLAFDTAPIIYFVEANPKYDAVVSDIFQRVDSGAIQGVTSVISLLEVLVIPIRSSNSVLRQQYTDLLLQSAHFDTEPITADVAQCAADLRARYGLRTPDALQVAVAIVAGCQAFLTNDLALKRVSELSILVVDELEL